MGKALPPGIVMRYRSSLRRGEGKSPTERPSVGQGGGSVFQFQHGKKSFLRNFYVPDLAHALFTFFLFF